MDAKAYLESYAALKMEVRMSEDRILEAYNDTLLPSMAVGDGSQKTPGTGDRQERANIRYIEIKDRLQAKIDALTAEMQRIDTIIDSLGNPLHRVILRIRYTDTDGWAPTKWSEVALRMYGDDSEKDLQQVQRKAREALQAFAAAVGES